MKEIKLNKSDFILRPVKPSLLGEPSWYMINEEDGSDDNELCFRVMVWIYMPKFKFKKCFGFSLYDNNSPSPNSYTIKRSINDKWLTKLITGYFRSLNRPDDILIINEEDILKRLINDYVKSNEFFKYTTKDIKWYLEGLIDRSVPLSEFEINELNRAIDLIGDEAWRKECKGLLKEVNRA